MRSLPGRAGPGTLRVMIVVVGNPAWQAAEPSGPAGLACGIALAAAAAGAAVELVGRAGDDRAGDELVIALGRAGIGHVALLRDPARPTVLMDPGPEPDDPAPHDDEAPARSPVAGGPLLETLDVDLGLRYLTAFNVLIVTVDALDAALAVAVDAAAFAGAQLVVIVGEGSDPPDAIPAGATIMAAPSDDRDGTFANLIGAYAAGLDARQPPDRAFSAALGTGWAPDLS